MSPLRGVSPAKRGSRGAGAGLNPLSSRREVPMNFATLNKKWFHEVNISVTIPSPTRDAHAQTHARTHVRTYATTRHDTTTTTTTTSRIGRTCVYVYLRAYVPAIRTHINGRIYTSSFSHARSLSPSSPLSFSRAGPLFGVHHGGHARTREGPHSDTHTRACKRAAHARVKKRGKRERDRKNGAEGRSTKKSSSCG